MTAESRRIRLDDRGLEVEALPGETLLEALEREGLRMRRSCRNGVCEICEISLLQGQLQQRYPQRLLDGDPCKPSLALACTSVPLTDISVKIKGLKLPGEVAVKKLNCDIASVEVLNRDVYRVRLHLPATASQAMTFHAGQYLDICLPNGRKASFSIASAPDQGRDVELHIRLMPDSEMSRAVLDYLQQNERVDIEAPKGGCWLDARSVTPGSRLVFAAASTGFSQIKSMVEHLLANQVMNPIRIYWGARNAQDLYHLALPEQWAREHANVHFVPVVSEPELCPDWIGRFGTLPQAILEDLDHFEDTHIYASGSPAMVYALLDACEAHGMQESQLHSDVFAYAPRPAKQ
ncbi:2Fe-2S iron-sulfur cluster-binding protein [Marinobacterium aestuariivivens]|uniref:2Fe-2S iron-sulfur cluster-binding protein n=1 Tax=Marinobacterium aestuariivivens TaxID=1698799 RepID=A0ABW2A0H0_9GAMM